MKNAAEIFNNAVKFNKSRHNLLFVVIFSLVNVILTASNAGYYFLFSASLPLYICLIGNDMANQSGAGNYIFIVIALLIIFLYFLCWLLSGKYRYFMVISLVMFGLDTLFLVFLILDNYIAFNTISSSELIDLAFHGFILYYLIIGTIAWGKLFGLKKEEFKSALAPQGAAVPGTENTYNTVNLNNSENNNDSENNQ